MRRRRRLERQLNLEPQTFKYLQILSDTS